MVALQFTCPHCSGVFQVDSSMSGGQVACPHCRNVVVLPATSGAAPVQPTYPQTPGVQQPFPAPTTLAPQPQQPHEQPVRPPSPQAPVSAPVQEQAVTPPSSGQPLRPVPIAPQTPQQPIGGPTQQQPTTPVSPAPAPVPTVQPTGTGPRAPESQKATPKPTSPKPTGAKAGSRPLPMSAPIPVPTSPAQAATSPAVGSTPGVQSRGPSGGGEPLVIPTEDGTFVTLREPLRTVGEGDEEIELRSLTAEEKERKKLKKNLIVWGFGLVIIAIVVYALLTMGPISS